MKETRYYSSCEDDFEESANQNYTLPESYEWIKNGILSRLLSGLVYGIAVVLGGAYCKCFLHMKVKGRRKLKGLKGDFFIYSGIFDYLTAFEYTYGRKSKEVTIWGNL